MTINNEESYTDYTSTTTLSPCFGCKRKNCTMSSFYGKRCEFAIYRNEYNVSTGYEPYKPRPYVKKQKNKKRVYHRGKF